MPTEVLHVFFDTTELTGDLGRLGRIASSKLQDAAKKIDARLYVVDLSVTELVKQQMRRITKKLASARDALAAVKTYISVSNIEEPDSRDLEKRLRRDIEQNLQQLGVDIVSASGKVTLDDVLALSTERVPPFRDEHNPRGFHDAVILLASLGHARAIGLKEIIFVSNDSDHDDGAVQRLGKERGLTCRLVKQSDFVAQMMEDLAAAHVKSFVDKVVNITTAFIEKHRPIIDAYLEAHPPKIRDFFPSILPYPRPTAVLSLRAGRIIAIPSEAPREGTACSITFYVNVIGEFEVEEFTVSESPIAELEAKPGAIVQPGVYVQALGPLSVPVPERVIKSIELSMAGRARATFRSGEFVGAPTIQSLEVRKPSRFIPIPPPLSSSAPMAPQP